MNSIVKGPKIHDLRDIPFGTIQEFLFHGWLGYSMLSVYFGINIQYMGTIWLFGLAALTLLMIKWNQINKIYLVLVFTVSALHISIQAIVYGFMPLQSVYIQPFTLWLPVAIIIYPLVSRPGFVLRHTLVMFFIAILLSPSIVNLAGRIRLTALSGIDNANDFAAWMSFIVLVIWLQSWKKINRKKQIILLFIAFISIYFILQTVSRGAIIALIISAFVGIRSIPRNRWPKFLFIILFSPVTFLLLPIFQQSILLYENRLYEDTGRLNILESSIQAIEKNPVMGYGIDRIGGNKNITSPLGNVIPLSSPHDAISLLWLSSGVFPVIPFILMWILAFIKGYKYRPPFDSPYLDGLPLVTFSFLITLISNANFMAQWAILSVGFCYLIPNIYNLSPDKFIYKSNRNF